MSKFFDDFSRHRFSVIAGPCIFESKQHAFDMAGSLLDICRELNVNFIYKTSFDKANRTSLDSFRGVDFDETMYAFQSLRRVLGVELLTDVHEEWHCDVVEADVIQIPAFLCRQTNLLRAAALSGKPVNVKKGQFLSPWEMKNVVDKLIKFKSSGIMVTERGTTFGYNNLVVDMRSLEIMKDYAPVILDCTHAVQSPGGQGKSSGGDRRFAPLLARAGVAAGVLGIFMEVHQDPDHAPSDGPNMVKLSDFKSILIQLLEIHDVVRRYESR